MKQRRHTLCLALTAFVLAATLPAALPASVHTSTPRLNFESGVCVDLADTLEPPRSWIPVGCESVLCCPGCPDAAIDWRIRVSGDPLESVLLQFENLPPEAARKLRIKGHARWEGNALRVMPGETIVSGFRNDPRAAPAVATPRLFANKERLRQLREAADREEAATGRQAASPDTGRPLGRMEVFVEQLMGKYAVSEARIAYNVRRCPRLPNTGDRIILNNNRLNDNVIALIDAPGSVDCVRDEPYRGVVEVNVGDLRPLNICTSETSIFSDENGMFFQSPTIWTDSASDEKIANLPEMFRAPVVVWIVDTDPTTLLRAALDMANANYLYNSNKIGIAFDAIYVSAHNFADANKGCAALSQIKASGFFKPGTLNVYYIDNPALPLGRACWDDGDNKPVSPGLIFVNQTGNSETLAHEFGHAFSLDDLHLLSPDVTAGIGFDNLMGSSSIRSNFTIGQAFRMNVNSISMINVNGVRVGWGVRGNPPCFDATKTDWCPKLSLDVTPK